MENSKMIKTAKVADKILKIAQGFMIAFIIVAAIFSVLTAILGEKIIADASTLNLGNIALTLAGDSSSFLNASTLKAGIIAPLISTIVVSAVGWICIKILRGILAPMKEGRPFEAGTAEGIRKLAWTILIGGAAAEAARTAGHIFEIRAYNLDLLFNQDLVSHVSYNIIFSLWFVAAALILFFLSFIFRYGEELQKESDETL